MKKRLSLLLALSLAISMFAGCSSVTTTTSVAGSDKKQEQQAKGMDYDIASAGNITIKVEYFNGGYGREWFDWLATEFNKKYPNVKVEAVGDANIDVTIASRLENQKDTPDVVFLSKGKTGVWQRWGSQGYILELSDMYASKVPDTESTLNEYSTEPVRKGFFYDEKGDGNIKKYAVSWTATPLGIIYNKKLLRDNGYNEFPKTQDEFEKMCEDLKSKGISPITYPGIYPTYGETYIKPKVFQFFGEKKFYNEFIEPVESKCVAYKDEAILKAWQKWEDIFKKGWVMPGTQALNHTQSQAEFLKGKAACIFGGSWFENEMKEVLKDMPGYEIALAPVPADGVLNKRAMVINVGDYAAIPACTKYPEVAKAFLLFSCSPEANIRFAEISGGIKGYKTDFSTAKTTDFIKSCVNNINDKDVIAFSFASSSPIIWELTEAPTNYKAYELIASGNKTAKNVYDDIQQYVPKEFEKQMKALGLS